MEFTALDMDVVAGLILTLTFTLCVALMFLMRDTEWAPPRVVSRSVWCEERQQRVAVDIVEYVETGLTIRSVQRCPLRGAGERCSEDCCYPSEARFRLRAPTRPAPTLL